MLLGTLLIAVTGLLIFCLGELVVFKRTVEKELHASPFADTAVYFFFRAEQRQLSARRNRGHRENALILCWELSDR
jgi:hypothetical protein